MGTTVVYNGVVISECLTRQFEEEVVYDDSNTDQLYRKFRVRVTGWVTTIYRNTTVDISTNITGNTADAETLARTLLLEPRKDFLMTVGGITLLASGPAGDQRGQIIGDVNNGPKPIRCNVNSIVGSQLMPIDFEIEICAVECSDLSNNTGVLNNRWTLKDSYDKNFYTTRTLSGRLRLAGSAVNPHLFRTFCFPVLQNGFRRDSVEVTSSADGLTLDYTVVDLEVYAAAPDPACTWEGTHTLATGDGVNTHGEVQIRVDGDKSTPKDKLLLLCMAVAQQKLFLGDANIILEQAAIIDHFETNTIEMRASVRLPGGYRPLRLLNLPISLFGDPFTAPGYDKDKSRQPTLFGTATPAGLLTCFLQSPCNGNHAVPQVVPEEQDQPVDRGTATRTYTYNNNLPQDPTIAGNYDSQAQSIGTYTYYKVETEYEQNENAIQLPIAASSAPSSGNNPTAVFVQMAPPTLKRKVLVTAQRYNQWPVIPQAATVTVGDQTFRVIGRQKLGGDVPQFSANGLMRRFESTCEYNYGLLRPKASGESFEMGRIPWDTSPLANNNLPASALDSGLLT